MNPRRLLLIILFLGSFSTLLKSQDVGVSFSFFFPRGGEFSIPVSPFSYRGLALPFNDYVGIQTGASLYRMGGLNVKGVPFESREAFYGPNLTFYVPLELYLAFGNKKASMTFKAGAFGFWSVFNQLNYGNIDRAIRSHENWDVANAEFDFRSPPGWGYQGGIEFLFSINRQIAVTIETNYLMGSSKLGLNGSYTGGVSGNIETKTVDYPDSYVDLTGLELSFGLIFSGR